MLIVNTDFISGRNVQTMQIVNGWGFMVFGVNLQKAASRANKEMEDQARQMGADAIINVRYSFSGGNSNCVLASGTAVRFV